MKHLKRWKIFESSDMEDFEDSIGDIIVELEDIDLQVSTSRIRKEVEVEEFWRKSRTDLLLEVYISRPWRDDLKRVIPGVPNPEGGYPGNLFFWYEIKETIIRLTKWYYEVWDKYEPIGKGVEYRTERDNSPLRFFGSGIEIFTGFSKEEDCDELFKSKFNIVRIFGGAIRDTIADQDINDVDILCGSKSIKYIEAVLEKNGYQYMESLNSKHLQDMYSGIHIINEPHTWIKGKKIVQLIRPSFGFQSRDEIAYREGFTNLISNVDLSCCGVSYDGEKLYEDYPNAIIHCQSKVFSVNVSAKMYSQKRIYQRTSKLESRGWSEIKSETGINRELKLDLLV